MMAAHWTELFRAVLAETDSERLARRIQQANAAITERVDQLLDDPDRQPEHDEILNALSTLARIQFEINQRVSMNTHKT
jgi:hypothetical protein